MGSGTDSASPPKMANPLFTKEGAPLERWQSKDSFDDTAAFSSSFVQKQKSNGSKRWLSATRAVALGLNVSRNFSTLRDQHGINEIKIAQLKTTKKLGEGAFATVEQCLYTPAEGVPYQVAVKKLKPDVVCHTEDLESFLAEVALMRKLNNKHIVEYIGVGAVDNSSEKSRQDTMYLVSELMEGGTLKKLVQRQMTEPYSLLYSHQDGLRWCIQIAEALAYLHSSVPMVIHRDLKLENILLKSKDVQVTDVKLADFGLVAFVQRKHHAVRNPFKMPSMPKRTPSQYESEWKAGAEHYIRRLNKQSSEPLKMLRNLSASFAARTGSTSTACEVVSEGEVAQMSDLPSPKAHLSGRTGTLMYMAPEMYKNEQYDEKVDVFSFGVVMYEILHKYMMLCAISIEGTEEEVERYAERVSSGFRPPLSEKFHLEVRTLIADCWAQDPKNRPGMQDVVRRLHSIQSGGLMPAEAPSGCSCVIC